MLEDGLLPSCPSCLSCLSSLSCLLPEGELHARMLEGELRSEAEALLFGRERSTWRSSSEW